MKFSRATEIFNARQAHKETNSDAEAIRKYSFDVLMQAKREIDVKKIKEISEHYFFLQKLYKELFKQDLENKSGVVC